MHRIAMGLAAGVLAATPAGVLAADAPDLTGTWQVEATAIGHPHGKAEKARAPRLLLDRTFEFVVDWQEGQRFSGRDVVEDIDVDVGAVPDELFSGIIGPDGTSAHIVDDNGSFACTIVSPDRLDCIYEHIAPDASVVGFIVWTRQP